jgi:ribokinase
MGTRAVIIKAGSTGVWYFDEQDEFFCPTFRVNARDTTAAGDVFNAAFAAGLGMDLPVAETLRFANAAAAISVTGDGAQGAMPTFDTVEALLREDPRTVARRL